MLIDDLCANYTDTYVTLENYHIELTIIKFIIVYSIFL